MRIYLFLDKFNDDLQSTNSIFYISQAKLLKIQTIQTLAIIPEGAREVPGKRSSSI